MVQMVSSSQSQSQSQLVLKILLLVLPILTRSVFGAISIGNGLVAAVLLCMKWERSLDACYFGYSKIMSVG